MRGSKKRAAQGKGPEAQVTDGNHLAPVLQALLLGEANFSFALALRSMLEQPPTFTAASTCEKTMQEREAQRELHQKHLTAVTEYFGLPAQPDVKLNITATCYESHSELEEKYPEAVGILSRLWTFAVDISWDLSCLFENVTLESSGDIFVLFNRCFSK